MVRGRYGILKLRSQSSLDANTSSAMTSGNDNLDGAALSFANPVYEPNNAAGPSYKVEDVIVKLQRSGSAGTFRVTSTSRAWNAIKRNVTIFR